jgi:molybdopterin-containing oxidoreductase family iron-sulfur binding subunit
MSERNRKTYWRSLHQLQDTPEFRSLLEREFPVAAAEFPQGVSRRRWMQLMGASLALGGLAGCRWQAEKIAPFAVRPENRVPGEPEYFATSLEIGDLPRHLLVTCYDGRPVKVEGNLEHTSSRGASDVLSQASLLTLYDPDRSDRAVQRAGRQTFSRSWDDFAKFAKEHFATYRTAGGAGLALLFEPTGSVSMEATLKRFRKEFPKAELYRYSAITRENALRGSELAFGRPQRTHFDLSAAKVIVCVDADLFGLEPNALRHARDFAERRQPGERMNRLYAVESQFSTTGAAADHRLPLRSGQIGLLVAHIDTLVRSKIRPDESLPELPALGDHLRKFASAVADDLVAHRGECVVIVGRSQTAEVHALAHSLNAALDNVGKTVNYTDEPATQVATRSLPELCHEIEQGLVNTLIIVGGNPAYDAPADLKFDDAMTQVSTTIRLATYEDETSHCSTWHLPQAHAFEAWGDVRAWDGTISISQPLISPLLNGRSALEFFALLLDDRRAPQQIVREAVAESLGRRLTDAQWSKSIHDGYVESSALSPVQVTSDTEKLRPVYEALNKEAATDVEVVFTPCESVLDGRFANNGWLQETPRALTKLTWDNAAIVSPRTAEKLGIRQGSLLQLKHGDQQVEIPAFVLPGQADGSIGVALGYGRTAAGLVGGSEADDVKAVGVNVNPIRCWEAREFTSDIEITPTAGTYEFATTQDHHSIDTVGLEETGRRVGQLVREGTLAELQEHPDFVHHLAHHPPAEPLWNEPSYDGHAWGMSIDLNKCIGCNACVTACQAENNIPIVGKEQVAKGREMHWIRVDRYFKGDVENPQVATQPVACQQCENAPCEQVCPVAATVHSDEGLNDMVYNRCVGTRYCANNCPYKVRRFNFFDYNTQLEEPNRQLAQLLINPEVTVRGRGVMEKCTYCVQRIQKVKIDATTGQRAIVDGEIKTACQQACPTQAIEFGDLNDPRSRVAEAHADARAYGMLAELNVKPRTKFLARIRNPNPALVDTDTPTESSHESPHGHS